MINKLVINTYSIIPAVHPPGTAMQSYSLLDNMSKCEVIF